MQVYLIRHTSPLIEKGVCYGQSDLSLNESLFEKERSIICSKIPEDIEVFYSSPLTRCRALAESLSPNIIQDERLMELNFGDWELCRWDELNQADMMRWMDDFVNNRVPNGENYLDLHQRMKEFTASLPYERYAKVGIVTHAGNIRSLISSVLDLPLQNSFRIHLNYGAVVELNLGRDKQFNELRLIL